MLWSKSLPSEPWLQMFKISSKQHTHMSNIKWVIELKQCRKIMHRYLGCIMSNVTLKQVLEYFFIVIRRFPRFLLSPVATLLYVRPFGWDSETDRRTHRRNVPWVHPDRHTDTRCQKYYTRHVRDMGCNKSCTRVTRFIPSFLPRFSCRFCTWIGNMQLFSDLLTHLLHALSSRLCTLITALFLLLSLLLSWLFFSS